MGLQANMDISKRYVDDFRLFVSECVSIRDHNTGQIRSLIFTAGQQVLNATAEKQKAEKG